MNLQLRADDHVPVDLPERYEGHHLVEAREEILRERLQFAIRVAGLLGIGQQPPELGIVGCRVAALLEIARVIPTVVAGGSRIEELGQSQREPIVAVISCGSLTRRSIG